MILALSFPVAPNLEHTSSVKRFVSFQFLNPRTIARAPSTGDQPVEQDNTNTQLTQTNMHALSGIRTHEPNVRAGEDISYLIPRGNCDQYIAIEVF
jgi:hypothetical protein